MGVARNPDGPLAHSEMVQYNEVVWWDQTRPPAIEERPTDKRYTVLEPDRLDDIAFKLLENPQLGWVIMERNNLRLMPNGLVPGRSLFIPTITSLKERGIIP